VRGDRLGTDSSSPRARHKFGFGGKTSRTKTDTVTPDDILDSLTRHAESRHRLGTENEVNSAEFGEAENLAETEQYDPEPPTTSPRERNKNLGHVALALMLLCGLTIVWLYASVRKAIDLTSIGRVIQSSGVESVFANQLQLAIVATAGLAGLLWIWHQRRTGLSLLTAS
jgi:hypothetical protein